MKQRAVGVRFHDASDGKENSDRFMEFYMALLEDRLLGGDYTKTQRCAVLEEMIAICKNAGGEA